MKKNNFTKNSLFQGFEARGTDISIRQTTWDNLLDSISHVGPLTTNPIQPVTSASSSSRRKNKKRRNRKKNRRTRAAVLEEMVENMNVSVEDGVERWRREAPLLSLDHRIAWLCGDPSKNNQVSIKLIQYLQTVNQTQPDC